MLFFGALSALAMSGCLTAPNMRDFKKDNNSLMATINQWGKPHYYYLRVSNPPASSRTYFKIELHDGRVVDLFHLDRDLLSRSKYISDSDSHRYDDGAFHFWYRGDDLVGFDATYSPEHKPYPILWNSAGNKKYAFPLSQADVDELFGPPDEMRDYTRL